ncbi:hypothetical protein bcCo53_001145 (plasmid) [Borrelia coriaceae]|uniref:Lipoprotein n=1 Tax=Borrelia coriaceae ATCC 43381 TaxID=1408429 RepID=W5SVA5_9SPIR|nr:hypothetical protein [Borrelia coriaceae]AHH11149.1 hypothetical protein BCO_0900030 [Borrelia coriaceae ATCC 43381]UPA16977.1 hypothetical protein bcCo53_001145 [Borrelia coriaceae]
MQKRCMVMYVIMSLGFLIVGCSDLLSPQVGPSEKSYDVNAAVALLKIKYKNFKGSYFANKPIFDPQKVKIPFNHVHNNVPTFPDFNDEVKDHLYAGIGYDQDYASKLENIVGKLLNAVDNAGEYLAAAKALCDVLSNVGQYFYDVISKIGPGDILDRDNLDKIVASKDEYDLVELVALLDRMLFLRYNVIDKIGDILVLADKAQGIANIKDCLLPIIDNNANLYRSINGNTTGSLKGLRDAIERRVDQILGN